MANSNDEAARVYDLMEKLLHPEQYAARLAAREEMTRGFLKRGEFRAITYYLDAPTHCRDCGKPVDADSGWCTHCGER